MALAACAGFCLGLLRRDLELVTADELFEIASN